MQEPADINGKLDRFGAGQEHAVIERVQKARLTDPFLFLDQLGLHDRDLPGWPAKGNEAELQPEPKCLGKRG